jgi:2-polyprenyl-3-methyl-5-hydroxy-6-metoxy-1,4-benzoquinol methylase
MIPCDICGDKNPQPILESPLLDGPLVQCSQCGLRYVGRRLSHLAFGSEAAAQTVSRQRAANARIRNLQQEEEDRLALLDAKDRVGLIKEFRPSGKLLEVGCRRGNFLRVAREYFTAFGVEPNPDLAAIAGKYAPVRHGTISDETGRFYDVAASFHVIEHVNSPKRFVMEIAERLRPEGLLVLETPDIDSAPFRIMKSRWRQFIPEHYYFFEEQTIRNLLETVGYKVLKVGHVGKHATVSLLLNRLSRYFAPLHYAEDLSHRLKLSRFSFELDPMDIMIVVAARNKEEPEQQNKEDAPSVRP